MISRLGLMVAGGLLLSIVGLVSNSELERVLLTEPSRTLAWGPSLFRVLLTGHGLALILAGVFLKQHFHKTANAPASVSNTISGRPRVREGLAWAVLIVLSILALGLRVWRLDSDLWIDEIGALLNFTRPPLGEIVTSFPSQNQHMLYSILAHAAICLVGESAWALRLPAVVFGVGSLWALFLLGRRVIGTQEALLACTLMTVSYHHIWFSQNARGYTGLLFFATLATWLWLEALAHRLWHWWLCYAIALSLGMWLHMTMAFVIAAHGLLYLGLLLSRAWRGRGVQACLDGVSWQPLMAWLLCGSVTLQLYALSLPEFLRTALHQASLPSEWSSPLWVVVESLRSLKVGFSGAVVVLGGGVLASIGWLHMLHQDWRAGLAIVLPPLLAGITMLVLGHYLWPRFFFFAMGFALLIVIHGAMTAPRLLCAQIRALRSYHGLGKGIGLVLAGLMIVASGVTVSRCYALPKQDFRGARDYVEQQRKPGDGVVAVALAGAAYGDYFAPHWSTAQTQAELQVVRQAYAAVWLVYTLPIQLKAYHPDVWTVIEQDFEVVRVFPGTLGGGELYVCKLRVEKEASHGADG